VEVHQYEILPPVTRLYQAKPQVMVWCKFASGKVMLMPYRVIWPVVNLSTFQSKRPVARMSSSPGDARRHVLNIPSFTKIRTN